MNPVQDLRPADRTLAAAGAILAYAAMVTFADSFVREIAETSGLMQFQVMRAGMAMMIFAGMAALPFAIRLWPRNWRGVAARGLVQTVGMLVYYGTLAFMTVAEAVAGLFTAPIFVLLIGRLFYGHPLRPLQIVAALVGFAGVLMALAPGFDQIGLISLAPMVAGALYALANVATREWCAGESAYSLTAFYMAIMGLVGGIGMVLLWLLDPAVPAGAEGFLLRGPAWPGDRVLLWTGVQALAAVFGVSLMVRAYQLAEAGRVAVFEYVILPFSAIWGWLLFGQTVTPLGLAGMALIVAAGVAMARGGRTA